MNFKGKLNFIKSNLKETNSETLAGILDVNKSDLPAIRILDFGASRFKKYKTEDFLKENLETFI